eukprot:scaffold2347_cov173-Amphora_coffeaeformis.AAC.1
MEWFCCSLMFLWVTRSSVCIRLSALSRAFSARFNFCLFGEKIPKKQKKKEGRQTDMVEVERNDFLTFSSLFSFVVVRGTHNNTIQHYHTILHHTMAAQTISKTFKQAVKGAQAWKHKVPVLQVRLNKSSSVVFCRPPKMLVVRWHPPRRLKTQQRKIRSSRLLHVPLFKKKRSFYILHSSPGMAVVHLSVKY